MFRESLLETSRDTRTRRGWATMTSFGLEVAFVGAMILVPLIYTDALPSLRFSEPVPPPPGMARGAKVQGRVMKLTPVPAELRPNPFEAPSQIPVGIDKGPGPAAQPVTDEDVCATIACVEGGTGTVGAGGGRTNLLSALLPPGPAAVEPPKVETRRSVMRISHVDPAMLVMRVEPKYPTLALQTRTQGEVMLAATIGRDGRIENLHVVSGHPLLIAAAMDAVRQWRYRPFVMNGQTMEVETQIAVRFYLNQ